MFTHTAVKTSKPTPLNTMPLSAVDLRLAKLEESPDLFVMCCRQQFVLKRVLNPCQAGNMLIQRHDILLTTSQQDA